MGEAIPRILAKSVGWGIVIRILVAVSLLLGAGVLVAVGGVAWLKLAPRRVPPGQPPLTTLSPESLPAFRETFNASQGKVRILVMLSPT